MQILETDIAGVKLIQPRRHDDERGFFAETFRRAWLREAGIEVDFVQDNIAFSATRGTVRGLHFQTPPHAQAKLIQVIAGAVCDVVVDLRPGSPTRHRWQARELSAGGLEQLYVPAGLAHGYCTLRPDTLVAYKVSAYYAPAHEKGLHWRDPDLAIDWPGQADPDTVSARDRVLPSLADLPDYFAAAPMGAK